ncbi:MAG: putative toxin-antitoxin system toxin component, PIN family, partial [Thermoprotei archaeon]
MNKKEIKAVLDTSVIVSSLLGSPHAAPAKVLKAMLQGAFQAYTSKQALEELYDVLLSDKIAELLGGRVEAAALTFILVNSKAKTVKPQKRIKMCRDPDD